MTGASWALLVAALAISVGGFLVSLVMSSRGLVQAASAQHVAMLESRLGIERTERAELDARLTECELDRKNLHAKVEELEESELRLRRRLDALERGSR